MKAHLHQPTKRAHLTADDLPGSKADQEDRECLTIDRVPRDLLWDPVDRVEVMDLHEVGIVNTMESVAVAGVITPHILHAEAMAETNLRA